MPKNYELGNLVWRITGDKSDFDKNLSGAEKNLTKFSGVAITAGKNLTKFVTLPLAALGLGALKASSDLAESANAVSVVFGDSAATIDEWGQTAAENAGLTQASFNSIATIIGAQLKQSGLDIDDVATSTIDLTQRAADLASVFNTDVTDAAGALGAALRGESEPARRYAINLSEAAVQAEALASGLIESKSEMTDQIKVQARLNLIMKQSNDVAGDFQNTSESLANRTRILKSEIINIAAELGDQLVPIAEDVLGVVGDLIGKFADLDDGTKKLILQIAFFAGAAGPLLLFVGNAVKAGIAVKNMAAAIKVMNLSILAGPLGIIALLGAATVAVALFSNKRNKDDLNAMADALSNVKDAASLSTDQLEEFGDIIRREISKGNTDFEGLNIRIEELAEKLGISKEEVIKIGVESGKLVGQYRDQFSTLQLQNDQMNALLEKGIGRVRHAGDLKVEQEEITDAMRDQQKEIEKLAVIEEARVKGVIAARKLTEKNFNADIDLIERKGVLELLTAEEVIEAKISAEEKYQEQLLEIGFDGLENEKGQLDIGDQQLLDSIDRKKEFVQELEDFTLESGETILSREEAQIQLVEQLRKEAADAERIRQDTLIAKYSDVAESYVTNFTSAFEAVGEALFNQEDAWASVGAAALGTIAEIIRALGSQLAAEAALLYAKAFFTGGATIPAAIAATAGSAVAFTAAGVVNAAAQNFQDGGFVQPIPGAGDTGDNIPAGLNPREIVLTEDDAIELLTAIRSGGLGGVTINQYNTLNTDSEKNMERAARQLFPYLTREGGRVG